VTDPASHIKYEVQELVQLQIDTLKQESSLTPSDLCEYTFRSERIRVLYSELDRIGRVRFLHELDIAC